MPGPALPPRHTQCCSHYPTTSCLFGWRPYNLVVSEFLNVGRRCRGTVPVTLASMTSTRSAATSIFAVSLFAARISTRTVTIVMMRPFLSVGFVSSHRALFVFWPLWPRRGCCCSGSWGRFILWRMIVILHWTTASSIGLWYSALKNIKV